MNSFVTAARNAGASFTRRTQISWRMIIAAFALLIALIASFLAFRYLNYRNVQENFYGQVFVPALHAYDFHLIDQNGKAFQLSQLRGKVVLFYFGFTHCPNICPTTLTDLEKVYRALPDKARPRVQIIFVTVDPQRDNPELMKKYLSYFDPDFLGLTGSADQVSKAAAAYGATFEKVHNPGEDWNVYFMNHSAFTYLINPDGKWELLYDFDKLHDTMRIVADIDQVLDSR
jgi:protein SCO1